MKHATNPTHPTHAHPARPIRHPHLKTLALASAAAATLLLLGACAGTAPSKPPPSKTITLTPAPGTDATLAPVLRPGDTLIITLNANPPQGGYAWINAGIADSVLEQQGPAIFTPAAKPGAPDTVTFTFVAKRVGAQMLNLAYRRINDRVTPLEKTHGVSVVVQE